VCWLTGLALHVWGTFGGPTVAAYAGLGLFVVGFFLFTAWAAAGGMPPMYRS
jgi:hypothetical protein